MFSNCGKYQPAESLNESYFIDKHPFMPSWYVQTPASVGPVTPVNPMGPCWPVGQVTPCSPVAPTIPVTPMGPVRPSWPVGP
jgi:hypothetical protein